VTLAFSCKPPVSSRAVVEAMFFMSFIVAIVAAALGPLVLIFLDFFLWYLLYDLNIARQLGVNDDSHWLCYTYGQHDRWRCTRSGVAFMFSNGFCLALVTFFEGLCIYKDWSLEWILGPLGWAVDKRGEITVVGGTKDWQTEVLMMMDLMLIALLFVWIFGLVFKWLTSIVCCGMCASHCACLRHGCGCLYMVGSSGCFPVGPYMLATDYPGDALRDLAFPRWAGGWTWVPDWIKAHWPCPRLGRNAYAREPMRESLLSVGGDTPIAEPPEWLQVV